MATKQDLETEVVELRAQLANLKAPWANPESNSSAEAIGKPDGMDVATSDDLQHLIEQATGAIDDHPTVKPLLLLMGVFGLGFFLGRSR